MRWVSGQQLKERHRRVKKLRGEQTIQHMRVTKYNVHRTTQRKLDGHEQPGCLTAVPMFNHPIGRVNNVTKIT